MGKIALLLLAFAALVIPIPLTKGSITTPYHLINDQSKQVECLAKNIYFESRGESKKGQVAVGFVTMNRLYNSKYPKSVCGVVYQKRGRECQFSWVCKNHELISDKNSFNSILVLSRNLYYNFEDIKDPTNGSLFFCEQRAFHTLKQYHNVRVMTKIGNHIFYKKHDARNRTSI